MFAQTTLENGIRIVSESLPHTRSIALGILFEVSPRNEPPQKQGIAHLAEHLFFQGTSSRSSHEMALFMDRAGGNIGAFTTRDYTFFGASILDDHLPYALELFGDALLNAIFPQENLEREKQSILAEIARSQDDPQTRAHDLLKQTIWGTHPLGRPIAGTAESVKGCTREDLIYFVHENYLPDRMIIAAAGNLIHEDLVAQVRDAFWRMIGESARVPKAQLPTHCSDLVIENRPFQQMYFSLGIPALPYQDDDRLALHLLSHILGSGLSSRLYRRLREELGLVYYIGTEYHAYREAGLLVIEGSTPAEHFETVIAEILQILRDLQTGDVPIDEEELNTAQMNLRGHHLLESEHSYVQMSRLATQMHYFGQKIASEDILNGFMKYSVKDLNQFAEIYLNSHLKNIAIAAVGPCEDAEARETQLKQRFFTG